MYNRDIVPFVDKDIETLVTVRDDLTGEELQTIRDIIMQHLPDHYSDVIPWREGNCKRIFCRLCLPFRIPGADAEGKADKKKQFKNHSV